MPRRKAGKISHFNHTSTTLTLTLTLTPSTGCSPAAGGVPALGVLYVFRGVAQLVSVPGLGPGGRQFESGHPDFARRSSDSCGAKAGFAGQARLFPLIALYWQDMYYVYILRSFKDSKYYIGSTSNVENRLAFHNAGRQRSTRRRIPFVLVHLESFPEKSQAVKREKQIKSYKGGDAFKRLVSGV